MADGVSGLVFLALYAACVAAALAHPPSRRVTIAKMGAWLGTVRYLGYELPLRLVTGRRRPDYARIAELERTELADLHPPARVAVRIVSPSVGPVGSPQMEVERIVAMARERGILLTTLMRGVRGE